MHVDSLRVNSLEQDSLICVIRTWRDHVRSLKNSSQPSSVTMALGSGEDGWAESKHHPSILGGSISSLSRSVIKSTRKLPGISSPLQLTHPGDVNGSERRPKSNPCGSPPWESRELRAQLRARARRRPGSAGRQGRKGNRGFPAWPSPDLAGPGRTYPDLP